jgi:hypothetical protein
VKLFDDDFIIVQGTRYLAPCWPPPDYIRVKGDGQIFQCTNHSAITDAQREGMTNVCRGAEYTQVHTHTNLLASEITEVDDLMPLGAVSLEDLMGEHIHKGEN